MTKFKVELIDRSGTRHKTITVNIPKNVYDLKYAIMKKVYQRLAGSKKYRSDYNAFWEEWTILQYWKD